MTDEAKALRQKLLARVAARNERAAEFPTVEDVRRADREEGPVIRDLARVVELAEELLEALGRLQRHDPAGAHLAAALAIQRTLADAYAGELERRRRAGRAVVP